MKRIVSLFVLSIVLLPAHAGMYDQPYGVVEVGDASAMRKEARLALSRIDGKSVRSPRKSDPIPPGKHTIRVSFSSARGLTSENLKDIEIDVEPCMRYRLVAKYESPTGPDWEPVVYAEPIGECRKKFMKDTSAK
jgi:hypothetical protein